LSNLSTLVPIAVMAGTLFMMTAGIAVLFKAFYRKYIPGEVMILNTMEAKPRVIKTGTLVLPIIYSASSISLNTQPIKIENDILHRINDLYGIKLQSIAVQVNDNDESILLAHQRISNSDNAQEKSSQLTSIVNQAIQEALLTKTELRAFKDHVATSLSKVGYELVVE